MRAAVDWVKHTSTLLRGFTLDLTIVDSECNPELTLADLGSRLVRGDKPDLFVGGGCSSVAVPLRQMTAAMRIPMVGAGATSGSLSSQPLYVRYYFSGDMLGQLAGAIAHSIELKSVGAVAELVFATVTNNLVNTKLNIASCGSLALSPAVLRDKQDLTRRLDKLHRAGCR